MGGGALPLLVTKNLHQTCGAGQFFQHKVCLMLPQQAIGCQKEIKKTLGMTSKTHAYLK